MEHLSPVDLECGLGVPPLTRASACASGMPVLGPPWSRRAECSVLGDVAMKTAHLLSAGALAGGQAFGADSDHAGSTHPGGEGREHKAGHPTKT